MFFFSPVLDGVYVHTIYSSFDITRRGLRAMYDTIPPQILLKEIKEEECGTKNDRTDIAAYCNIAVVVPAGSHLVGYFFGRKAL